MDPWPVRVGQQKSPPVPAVTPRGKEVIWGPVQVSAPRAARMPDAARRGQAAQEAREACLEAPSWWPEKRSCLCPRALAVSGQPRYGHIIW